MRIKLLKDVLIQIGGRQASNLAEIMVSRENVNEFEIGKEMSLTINQVRNILYNLSEYNLVTFTRQKEEKKGWYTYFWTLDEEKALEILNRRIEKKLFILEGQLKNRGEKNYYYCKTCKIEVSEETSLEHDFICQECGELYQLQGNKKVMKELKGKITKLQKERKEVFKELRIISEEKEKGTHKKKSSSKGSKMKKKRKKKKAKDFEIEDIKGIGKKKAEDLRKKGVKSVAGLLRYKPKTLAKKLGLDLEIIEGYQKKAKKLIG